MVVKLKKQIPVSKRLNSLLLYTGGLMSVGGLGWSVRLAYTNQPKIAIPAAVVSSAGAYFLNVVFNRTKENIPVFSAYNRLLLPGGILFLAGTGCCMILGLKEHPKSSFIAFIVGTVSYTLVNAAIFKDPMPENKESDDQLSPEELARTSFHFISNVNECEVCQAYVDREFGNRRLTPNQPK